MDDRWYPTKLHQQIAAVNGPAANAVVIGTAVQYFGEFQDVPTIPTGYIHPHTLCDVNPIINSSVILKKFLLKTVPNWIYPQIPGACEDYSMWMRIALAVNSQFFNLPDILVGHRIHANSAFNTSHDLKPLQEWYRQQIEETCRNLGIGCIPNEGHRYQHSVSQRHCETLRTVMDFVRNPG